MATFLFDDIIFGPLKSRRFGNSLGINLLPTNTKFCNYNCIYCECGWTLKNKGQKIELVDKDLVIKELKLKLIALAEQNQSPDNITFAGNGEPTIHPDFEWIVGETINLREKYAENSKITVLSNATLLHKRSVFDALKRVDNNVLKLDSAIQSTTNLINDFMGSKKIETIIEEIKAFGGEQIVQTMLLRGEYQGEVVDNTTAEEIEALTKAYQYINPRKILLYSIDRDTPASGLQKVSNVELREIADKLNKYNLCAEVY